MSGNTDLQRIQIPKGSFIFVEGDIENHFYVIEEGEVEIFTMQGKNVIHLATLGPGESFGEFALLDQAPRSASARALTDTALVKVSESGFEQMLAQIPDWASFMMRSFVNRLKSLNEALKKSPQFITDK